MATLLEVKSVLSGAYPGIRFTSDVRSQDEQDALVARGATKAKNSQHVSGTGLDMVLPEGVHPAQVRKTLVESGIKPTEFLNETGKGQGQGTGAHLHIGWGEKGARASRAPKAAQMPAALVAKYNDPASDMTPEQRARIAAGVKAGRIALPEGEALAAMPTRAAKPNAAAMSAEVAKKYTEQSDMTDAQRDVIDRNIAEGFIVPPPGVVLKRPEARTAGALLGMGTRNILEGAGGLVDVVASPLNATMNAAAGTNVSTTPFRDLGAGVSDALNLAKPGTPGEKLIGATVEGMTQGLMTAGAGGLLAGAGGTTGAVGRALAASPAADVIGSGAATGAMEAAQQADLPMAAQVGLGLAAGVGGVVATERALSGIASRLGKKAAAAIERAPAEALVDEAGELTEEGVEAAVRAQVAPDEFKAAVVEMQAARIQSSDNLSIYPPTSEQASKLARVESVPLASVRGTQSKREWDRFERGETEAMFPGLGDRPVAVRTEDGIYHLYDGHHRADLALQDGKTDLPMYVIDARDYAPEVAGRKPAPSKIDDEALLAELRRELQPVAPARPVEPATAASRFAEAESEGVTLSEAQATRDYEAYAAEQQLKAAGGPEAQEVRSFFDKQQKDLQAAVTRFREVFGDVDATPADRGAAVREALETMRDAGKAGVKALYDELKSQVTELQAKAGSNSAALLDLDTAAIGAKVKELLIDQIIPRETRDGLRQLAAQYGLIGKGSKVFEDGTTVVQIPEVGGTGVKSIDLPRPVERLSVVNAEKFRQDINALYEPMNPKTARVMPLAGQVDDATADALARLAEDGPTPGVARAATDARKGYKEQKKTFEAKDAVERVLAFKNGTPGVIDERVIDALFKSRADLKKAKAILLSKPTEQSKAAWSAIQAKGVGDLFDKAFNANANGGKGELSGAVLNKAIARFGVDKLKILLDPADFDQLMKLNRIAKNATIDLPNTTNPSGSGHLLLRFFAKQAANLAPVARMVPLARDVVAGAQEMAAASATKKTLEGVTSFKPGAEGAKAANVIRPAAFIRNFIDIAKSDDLIAPIIASAASVGEHP